MVMYMNDRVTKTTIFGVMFIIVLVSFYAMAISSMDEILVLITTILASFLLLLNIGLMFKNNAKTKLMQKKIIKYDVVEVDNHPLEVFVINKIWYHKKDLLTPRQIYAGLLYSIKKQELILSDKGIKINSNIERLPEYSRKVIEIAFLNPIECKQSEKLKLDRLNKIKTDNYFIETDELKKNIGENCKNRNLLFLMIDDVKEKYFTNIEGNNAAFLTILTVFVAILEFVLAIAFVQEATPENFYVPLTLSILLVGTVTNQYRERVTFQENKINDISKIINYISYIGNSEVNEIDQIYLYSLNRLVNHKEISKTFIE